MLIYNTTWILRARLSEQTLSCGSVLTAGAGQAEAAKREGAISGIWAPQLRSTIVRSG